MTHATLGASSAYRWIACPGSVKLEAGVEETASPDAEEGTQAHTAAAQALKGYLETGELRLPQSLKPEMAEAVSTYTEHVVQRYEVLKSAGEELVELYVERRVDFSEWVPDGCGTADAYIICGGGNIEVFDFKYGAGTPVYATGNPQLKLYALGVFSEYAGFKILMDGDATMTIIQPRLSGGPVIDAVAESFDSLNTWGETVAAPAAEAALSGQGELKPGAHCKYCKAGTACLKWLIYALDVPDTKAAITYNMAAVLAAAPTICKRLKDLKRYAYKEAINGRRWPGLKLVEGTAKRTIADPEGLARALLKAGYQQNTIYKPSKAELKSIGTLEKALTKKRFAELAKDYISVTQGAPKLVPEADPRPACDIEKINYDMAVDAFNEEE